MLCCVGWAGVGWVGVSCMEAARPVGAHQQGGSVDPRHQQVLACRGHGSPKGAATEHERLLQLFHEQM